MNSLIPDNLNSKLDEIVTKCFEGNRIMDRGMSVLNIKFVMNRTVKFLHPKLAHLFPLLGDKVSDYQGSRNNLTFYGITPADGTDYNTVLEFFERSLEYMQDLESLVAEALNLAREEDETTYVFLEHFLRKLIPITEQCLLLVDKAKLYTDMMLFDHNVEDFIIL